MAAEQAIHATFPAETRWVEDRWCATQPNTAVYAYGKTAQEASARLMEAMDALIDSLMIVGGEEAVRDYMKRMGLSFEISEAKHCQQESFSVVLPLMRSLKSD
jgi:hypothetical protein